MDIQTPHLAPDSPPPSSPQGGDNWNNLATPVDPIGPPAPPPLGGSPQSPSPLGPRRRIAGKWWVVGGTTILALSTLGVIGAAAKPAPVATNTAPTARAAPTSSAVATAVPTAVPTPVPTALPTAVPTPPPTAVPTAPPTAAPVVTGVTGGYGNTAANQDSTFVCAASGNLDNSTTVVAYLTAAGTDSSQAQSLCNALENSGAWTSTSSISAGSYVAAPGCWMTTADGTDTLRVYTAFDGSAAATRSLCGSMLTGSGVTP